MASDELEDLRSELIHLRIDLQRRGPMNGWKPPRPYRHRSSERRRRDPGPLMSRSWPEIPCEAPEGYFWKRQLGGKQNWWLYRRAVS